MADCVINNKHFDNIQSACDYYGVSYGVRRISKRKGISIEEVINQTLDRNKLNIINGVKFISVQKACKQYNVNYNRVRKIMKDEQLDLGQAIKYVQNNKHDTSCTVGGVEYKSVNEMCAIRKITVSNVNKTKREYNVTLDEAVRIIEKKRCEKRKCVKPIKYTINGIGYTNLKHASKDLNVSLSELRSILQNGNNIQIEKREERKNEYAAFGLEFKNLNSLCRHFNINSGTLYGRIKRGNTIEQAIQLGNEKRKKTYIVKGKKFNNVPDIASYFNVSSDMINKLKYKGMNIDDIIDLLTSSEYMNKMKVINDRYKNVEIDNVVYKDIAEVSRAYNVAYTTLTANMKKNPDIGVKELIIMYKKRKIKAKKIAENIYLCKCVACKRKICLTEEEILHFNHSEEVCMSREWVD